MTDPQKLVEEARTYAEGLRTGFVDAPSLLCALADALSDAYMEIGQLTARKNSLNAALFQADREVANLLARAVLEKEET